MDHNFDNQPYTLFSLFRPPTHLPNLDVITYYSPYSQYVKCYTTEGMFSIEVVGGFLIAEVDWVFRAVHAPGKTGMKKALQKALSALSSSRNAF